MNVYFLTFCSIFLLQAADFSHAEPVGVCPAQDGEDVIFLTDSESCSVFYKCQTGTPYRFECPPGLDFSTVIEVCVFPEDADCAGNNGGSDENNIDEPAVGPEDSEEEVPPPGTDDGNNNVDDNQAVGECPAEDGELVTLLPHATDCARFYICDRGTPVVASCPAGLLFNPQLSVCDFPESAGCGNGSNGNENNNGVPDDNEQVPPPGTDDGNNNVDDNQAVGECPAEDGELVTLLPHATDCARFYICDRGTPVVASCPAGLLFNPQLSVCDFPESAGCGNGSNGNENNNGVPDDNEQVPPPGTDDGNNNVDDNQAVGECPAEDGELVTLLPHATDCARFYICDRGTPVVASCPAGLLFNPQLLVCDFPESAGCGNGSNGNENNNGVPDDNEQVPPPGTDDGNNNVDDNQAVGECPAEDGELVTLLPHATDCASFYICDRGTPVVASCPAGLLFNPQLLVCDFPESAGCGNGSNGNENNNGVPDDNEQVPPPGTDDGNNNVDDNQAVGECPAEDGELVTLLPHATDCARFYICDRGTPVVASCPAGLLFNPQLLVCDFPESAGCGNGSNGNENNNAVPDDNEQVPPPGTDDGNNNVDDNQAVGECPAEDGELVTLLPHATDCASFYICDRGTPVVASCPAGLLFNPQLLVCDYPESAECAIGSSGSENNNGLPEEIEELPAPGTDDGSDNGEENQAVGECPAEDGELVTLLPHASDCTRFYVCNEGIPFVQQCPSGLLFNPQLLICDWPEQAGCQI